MLRKRNDMEAIEVLRKEDSHLRKIAKLIDCTPSTLMRLLQQLEEEKIIDFREEGKNKVYFLKNTSESETYRLMSENYKFLKIIQNAKLRRIIRLIKEIVTNELVILFGSYAKGSEHSKSDIDLYVETNSARLKEEIESISENIRVKIGNLDKESPLALEIVKNHIIINNFDRFFRLLR